jgi:hypothetical protein
VLADGNNGFYVQTCDTLYANRTRKKQGRLGPAYWTTSSTRRLRARPASSALVANGA